MPEFVILAKYIGEYFALLQLAAITGVACVLITNAASDIFATEQTGTQELGTGRPVLAQKYRGLLADLCRSFMFCVGGSLAGTYSALVLFIISSTLVIVLGAGCIDLFPLTTARAESAPLVDAVSANTQFKLTPVVPVTFRIAETNQSIVNDKIQDPDSGLKPPEVCLVQKVANQLPWTPAQMKIAIFGPGPLRIMFILVGAWTIFAACWIAFLSIILRWSHMRRPDVIRLQL